MLLIKLIIELINIIGITKLEMTDEIIDTIARIIGCSVATVAIFPIDTSNVISTGISKFINSDNFFIDFMHILVIPEKLLTIKIIITI